MNNNTNNDDYFEPAGAGNFLQRYHEMRAAAAANTPTKSSSSSDMTSTPTTPTQNKLNNPPSPPSSPSLRSKPLPIANNRSAAAKNVWGSVFHPLGRSPKTADRYDLSRGQQAAPGLSASELHAKGSGISLDDRQID